MPAFVDLTGHSYNRLTIVGRAENVGKATMWDCVCTCGTLLIARGSHVANGLISSCGCLQRELQSDRAKRHGMTDTPEYKTWRSMISRCRLSGRKEFHRYGGRGIFVCDRWADSFENFYEDMGPRPAGRFSIDRIDNNGPYSPENCKWSTMTEQARNKRTNRIIEHGGRKQTLSEWAESAGLSIKRVHARLKAGWEFNEALSPLRVTA